MIKITNLNKYFYRKKYNEIHVINDTTLEFPQSGLVTLLGESGSGKTTLLNVLGGLDGFDNGEIEIDGNIIKKYSARKIDKIRNEKIGYIFQNYLLLKQKTVYENLELVLNMYSLDSKKIDERITYVLNAVGMLKYKKKRVSELSGGQQQRIAIARALIKSPSLILADEPTGNLDEKNTIEIMNILKKISKTTLVILVSHEKRVAYSYSDIIIELKDGKVTGTKAIDNKNGYEFEDDQNIYLKELNYENIENDNVKISYYTSSKDKINLNIVYKNNKVYIESNQPVIVLDNSNEIKLIDDYKKVLDTEKAVEVSSFELEKLEFVKTPGLSFKERISLAVNNNKKMKKKTTFLSITLFVVVVLTLLCIQSIITASFVDKQKLTNTDSRIYNIYMDKGSAQIDDRAGKFGFDLFYKDFLTENPEIEPVINFHTRASYTMSTFTQLGNKEYYLSNFSVLPLSTLKDDSLIYGRLPENPMEIVVDKWVLENAINGSTLNNFMNVASFLNQNVNFEYMNSDVTIVGISETNQNSVYVNKWTMIDIYMGSLNKTSITFCSLSEFEKHLGRKLNIELDSRECLWNLSKSTPSTLDYFRYNSDYDMEFTIVKSVDFEGFPYTTIVSDDAYYDILRSVIKREYNILNVVCENEEEVAKVDQFINERKELFASGEIKANLEFGYTGPTPENEDVKLELSATSEYNKKLQPYYDEAKKIISSRVLITFTILVISVLIVLFSMKSFAVSNIYDIGVYRALGIKKSSVISIYAFEILFINLKTTLIGGILCYIVTNIISSIPIIYVDFAISFMTFVLVTFGLMLINIIVGIIPITRYMRLTPSQILTKHDL
ncbi:MAG: ABC transporter ATP-binding protein/permease [Erysipelotrichaceae bacterium]|nr:ABC transporter ATP-binding protein/permease [Erysipelotrichaceae bacterium]